MESSEVWIHRMWALNGRGDVKPSTSTTHKTTYHSYTHTCGAGSLIIWPTLDAGLELNLKQWCHQTFSVATETRSVLTLCERGSGFHARLNIWLTNVPSAVTHSAVWESLLCLWLFFPAACRVLWEPPLMYKEEILCMGVEKENHASVICLSFNLLRWNLGSVLLPEDC